MQSGHCGVFSGRTCEPYPPCIHTLVFTLFIYTHTPTATPSGGNFSILPKHAGCRGWCSNHQTPPIIDDLLTPWLPHSCFFFKIDLKISFLSLPKKQSVRSHSWNCIYSRVSCRVICSFLKIGIVL